MKWFCKLKLASLRHVAYSSENSNQIPLTLLPRKLSNWLIVGISLQVSPDVRLRREPHILHWRCISARVKHPFQATFGAIIFSTRVFGNSEFSRPSISRWSNGSCKNKGGSDIWVSKLKGSRAYHEDKPKGGLNDKWAGTKSCFRQLFNPSALKLNLLFQILFHSLWLSCNCTLKRQWRECCDFYYLSNKWG